MSRLVTHPLDGIGPRLNSMLQAGNQPPLSAAALAQFDSYYAVLRRWNAQINLTAIRSEEEILRRHFVESIAVARALPPDIRTLLDFGSGAGFPGMPIAICRPEVSVVLAESQNKKAAFLKEAVRSTGVGAEVYSDRAENIVRVFDCVTLRAVDRMQDAVKAAAARVGIGGWLALLVTRSGWEEITSTIRAAFVWNEPVSLPSAEARILVLGRHGD